MPEYLTFLMPIEINNVDIFISSTWFMAPFQDNAISKGRALPLRVGDVAVINDRILLHGKPPMALVDDSQPGWRLMLRLFVVLE